MEFLGATPEVLIRTTVVGALAYLALVAMLRISGKRTLSQMNAFDWVVTVALGSTLATILLTPDVSLVRSCRDAEVPETGSADWPDTRPP